MGSRITSYNVCYTKLLRGFMNAMTSIPPEIGDTIIAIIIYFAATSLLIHKFLDKIKAFIKGARKK